MSIWDSLIKEHGQSSQGSSGQSSANPWDSLIAAHQGATPKETQAPMDGPQAPGQPATSSWRGARFEEFKPSTPEEKALAGQVRKKADEILLQSAPDAKSPAYTATTQFANTALLNAPRNLAAAVHTMRNGDTFAHNYDYLRAVDEASARMNPKASIAGGIAGGIDQALMSPVAAAETWGARALQSGATGATLAGLAEFADSKDLRAAGRSAALGGALGTVLSPLSELGTAAVGRVVAPVKNMAMGALNPEKEAARRVGAAISDDISRGRGGITRQQAEDAAFNGQPIVVADLGGETTKALARSSANTSPEARDALNKVVNDRFEAQSGRVDRMLGDLSETGGLYASETLDKLQQKARSLNKPAYKAAYDKGANGVWNDELATIAAAPDVADAIAGATRTGRNKAVADGFAPVKNPFNVGEDGTISLKRNPDGSEAIPSLQFWDHVKQNLDDKINAYKRSGDKGAMADAVALKNKLVANLDIAVPEYEAARKGASMAFGAENALEAGQKFVTQAGENASFAKAISKFSEAERALFGEGFISSLRDRVSGVADRRSVLNTIFNSPKARERVSMALGPGKAAEVENMLHIERIMDELRGTVQGNSSTAQQLTELGLAGGASGAALGAASGGDLTSASGLGAAGLMLAGLARGKIDRRVAQKVGELLASGDPEAVTKVLKMANNSDAIRNFIRSFSVAKSAATSAHIVNGGKENKNGNNGNQ